MNDPRQVAARIVGPVEWETEVSGVCRCPGEALHTHRTGAKDCRVHVDGAPTIHCFHASCSAAVADANLRLRRELNVSPWAITLPGGGVLKSGDVLRCDGTVATQAFSKGGAAAPPYQRECLLEAERRVIETLTTICDRVRGELFTRYHWPFAKIIEDSPLLVAERDAEDQFRTWLRLWPADSTVWIGDVFDSGKPEHRTHFRPVADWYQIGPAMGNFTCGSAFKPGSFQRSNANLDGQRFLVVESDTLTKDEVGAVFKYLHVRLRYRLHCIVDTAGKSLHGWFDAPRNKLMETRLKAGLVALGCDPKVFTYSQPVRVPGAYREGKLQRLVWLRE